MTAAVVLDRASKSYGERRALDEVSLTVPIGQVVAVLGPNGAGKTTALGLLAGFLAPTTGTVRVLGTDPRHGDRAWRARIGLVLQSTSLDPTAGVAEWLSVVAAACADPLPLADVLAIVDLSTAWRRRIGTLSGGQQRRVDLASAIVGRPEMLFLDEPTTGLDPESRRRVWSAVGMLARAGTTVLLSTHYLDEVDALADRVVVLAGGRLVADGTPAELRRDRGPSSIRLVVPSCVHGADVPPGFTSRMSGPRLLLTATTTDVATHLDAIVRFAAHHNLDLASLEVRPPSLEDAYLALTRACTAAAAQWP